MLPQRLPQQPQQPQPPMQQQVPPMLMSPPKRVQPVVASPFAEPVSQIVSVTATVAPGNVCKQCNATKCKHTHFECGSCKRLFLTAADLQFHKSKRGH